MKLSQKHTNHYFENYLVDSYQLSNSQNNDWYAFVTISLSYKFLRKTDKCSFPIN